MAMQGRHDSNLKKHEHCSIDAEARAFSKSSTLDPLF